MNKQNIFLMLLTGLLAAGISFFLLLNLPVTISICYTSAADTTLEVSSTKKFGNSRNSVSFPVTFRKSLQPQNVSFKIPVSELRYLYLDIIPSASLQIYNCQFQVCSILKKKFERHEIRRNFRTDESVKSLYDAKKEVLLLSGSDKTGEMRLNIANDFPRLLPVILSVLIFLLIETVFFLILYIVRNRKSSFSGKIPGFILILFFLFLIFVLPALETLSPEAAQKQAPKLQLSRITKYPAEYSTWYRYNLPFRRKVFDFYHLIMAKFGFAPVKDVIIGKDSFLFSRREAALLRERPYDDYLGLNLFTDQELEKILKNLLQVQDVLKKRGIRFVVFIVPNKVMVYPDKLPPQYRRIDPDGPTKSKQLVKYIQSHSSIPVIYPLEALKKAAQSVPVPLYFRHDTHWNTLGAYVGARELFKVVIPEYAAKMPELSELKRIPDKPKRGDLATVMQAPEELIEQNIYTLKNDWMDPVSIMDAFGYYTLPPASNKGPRCFLIRDSFSFQMIPYLNRAFSQCAFYWEFKLNLPLIDAFKADIVVLETVERLSDRLLYLEKTKERFGRIELD